MNNKLIVVEISPDGTVTVRAEGYQGPSCADAVKKIAEALGGEIVDEEHTAEYYQTEVDVASQCIS